MNKNTSLKSTAPISNAAVTHRVQTLLGELGAQHLADLERYAHHQCSRSRWNPANDHYLSFHDGLELVHEVIADLLIGLENPDRGRHPRPKDLVSLIAFTAYLRGAIRSKRLTLADHAEAKTEHQAFDACSDVQDISRFQSLSDPAQETEHADLTRVAFDQLRLELDGSDSINQTLAMWEANLPYATKASELGITPRVFRRIRKRLRRIFSKLDFSPVAQSQIGTEIEL